MKTKILSKIFIVLACLSLLAAGFSCGGGGSGGPSTGTGTPPPDGGTQPPAPVCGNNRVETGEECDPPNGNTCDSSCKNIVLPFCKDGYCLVPEAKDFQLGSIDSEADSDENLPDGANRKLPPKVTISGFLMKKTEVTVGEYKKFLGKDLPAELAAFAQNKKGDDFPIVGLVFDEKRAFCKAEKGDGKGDLPTAAQVERAAKGKDGTDKYGTPITKAIIFCVAGDPECSQQKTDTEVVCGAGEKDKEERANSFGVCDLAGNVWESTSDQYVDRFYDSIKDGDKDPKNELTDQKTQVEEFRGGSFDDGRWFARSANRDGVVPTARFNSVGFRCVRPLPQ